MASRPERTYLKGTWQRGRAFSPAVLTRGGNVLWIAGHGAHQDDDGNSLAGDFTAQTHQAFKNLRRTMAEAGAALSDIVTMTVFIIDARYGDEFTRIRGTYFDDDEYPASALITVAGFARSEMMVEIQPIAVVD